MCISNILVPICFVGFFPIAFAVVDAENKDNWCWFLEHLCEVLGSKRVTSLKSEGGDIVSVFLRSLTYETYHPLRSQYFT